MRVGRVLAAAFLTIGSMAPAVWPYAPASDFETVRTPILEITKRAPAYPVSAADIESTRAEFESMAPFRSSADSASASASASAFRTYIATPEVASRHASMQAAAALAPDREVVFAARRLVLSSGLLLLASGGLIFGVLRLRRGRTRSGALLLVVGVFLVPLAIPTITLGKTESALRVDLPILDAWAATPFAVEQPAPAPTGSVWTPTEVPAALERVRARPQSADEVFLNGTTNRAAARTRFIWSAAGALVAALVAVVLRQRLSADNQSAAVEAGIEPAAEPAA